jgi:hypothetical protein
MLALAFNIERRGFIVLEVQRARQETRAKVRQDCLQHCLPRLKNVLLPLLFSIGPSMTFITFSSGEF